MKKIFLLVMGLVASWSLASAQLQIFPDDIDGSEKNKEEVNAVVESILTGNGWNTMDTYYQKAHELEAQWKCGVQLLSGVMTRSTILCYAKYVVKFVSQLGILIGAIMIIFAGYEYATFVFSGSTGQWAQKIKYAIIGVVVIVFSYAIMRIVTSAFLS